MNNVFSDQPEISAFSDWFENILFTPLTRGRATSGEVSANAFSLAATEKMSFQTNFRSLVFHRTWIKLDELYGDILFLVIFYFFKKTSPHQLQLFGRMLQHCFTVKLQKMLCGLLTVGQQGGRGDNHWTQDFYQTFTLKSWIKRDARVVFFSFSVFTNLFPDSLTRKRKRKVNSSSPSVSHVSWSWLKSWKRSEQKQRKTENSQTTSSDTAGV